MVRSAPLWAVFVLPAVLAALVVYAAVLDAAVAAVEHGHPRGPAVLAVPFREAGRLLVQQRRTTPAPDALLWRIGGGALLVVGMLMLVVVPLGHWSVTDLSVGVVWFNMMDVTLWAVVWLAGWGPNSQFALIGAYRWLAQALSYELPLMFAITSPAVAAQSLRIGSIAAGQQHLWYVTWMPVAFVVFLVAVLGFSLWGPFGYPDGPDLAGGVVAELSGADRLVFVVGRHAVLAAGSAFAAAVFLGAGDGPVLPAWAWSLVKTLAVLGLLVAVRRRLPTVRMDRFAEIGWLVLLPAALLQLLAVTLIVLFRAL